MRGTYSERQPIIEKQEDSWEVIWIREMTCFIRWFIPRSMWIKTGLIGYCNRVINTMQRYICVSRPRRFGKSMAANMLSAYYSRECDSEKLFEGLEISKGSGFKKHLNQYDTIFLNMQEFLSRSGNVDKLIDGSKSWWSGNWKQSIRMWIIWRYRPCGIHAGYYREKKIPFVVIIDEWDCIFIKILLPRRTDRITFLFWAIC